jgi:oligopeptide/dipeptide ABC transporter ATP-binding protein
MGLLDKKHSRVSGEALFDGQNLLALSEKKLRALRGSEIAMVFQDPLNSLSPLETVGSQLRGAMKSHLSLSEKEIAERSASLLARVGLRPETAARYPFELSGGMQQRVMIALAVSCSPRLIIADEPTTALDVTIQAQVLALLKELTREMGLSVLLITHNFAVVAETCDRVSVMYAGRIVESAATSDLIRAPAHPYSRALIDCIPGRTSLRTSPNKEELPVIPGFPPRLLEPPRGCPFAPRCPRAAPRCGDAPRMREAGAGRTVCCHYPLVEDSQ